MASEFAAYRRCSPFMPKARSKPRSMMLLRSYNPKRALEFVRSMISDAVAAPAAR